MDTNRKAPDNFGKHKGFLITFALLVVAYGAQFLLGRRLSVDDGKLSDKVRLGFFLAILLFLFVMIVIPISQVQAASGLIMLGLAMVYMVLENQFGGDREEDQVQNRRASVTSTDAIDERLKRLRRAYYQSRRGDIKTRALEREMNKIHPACRRYYERILETEASIVTLLNTSSPRGVDPEDLMRQIQTLSRQITVLVEQLQLADQLIGFYDKDTDEDIMVQRARQKLIRRADRAMEVLEGVPARLLQLTTATSNRGLDRLVDDLRRMNERLEGKAQAYETMSSDHELTLEELYAHLEVEAAAEERSQYT